MQRQSAADTDDITMTNVPLALIVLYAYWTNDPNLIAGMPDWAWSERYDLIAKVAPSDLDKYHRLDKIQRAAMLQPVLADRFKLQAHHETKDRPVYTLVIAKNGPKLKQATPGEVYPSHPSANGFVHGSTVRVIDQGQISGEGASMAEFATTLSNVGTEFLGRPVVDKTNLTGRYDFMLQFTSDMSSASISERQQAATSALFTALQDQLGLKLQPATAPTDRLVIDHIERPTSN